MEKGTTIISSKEYIELKKLESALNAGLGVKRHVFWNGCIPIYGGYVFKEYSEVLNGLEELSTELRLQLKQHHVNITESYEFSSNIYKWSIREFIKKRRQYRNNA